MTPESPFAADLDLALQIADAADRITMSRYLAADLRVTTKPDTTPVTEADQAAEQAIRELLTQHRPDDQVLGEEFGAGAGGKPADPDESARRWILDPIDGTKNYLRGVPVWCTLIALEVDGDVVVGVASAPAMGRRWWAAKGLGAHTRDVTGGVRQLHCSSVERLADASFSYSDELGWEQRGAAAGLRTLIDTCWRTRAYGDFLSHVLVAEGAVDVAAEPALAPWDLAALVPIVTESGGRITGFSGEHPLAGYAAVTTNGHLHEDVLSMLRAPGSAE